MEKEKIKEEIEKMLKEANRSNEVCYMEEEHYIRQGAKIDLLEDILELFE